MSQQKRGRRCGGHVGGWVECGGKSVPGISELLQIHGIDPLTVAAQTGTSLAMIEKAYLRFIPSAMREKLAAAVESA